LAQLGKIPEIPFFADKSPKGVKLLPDVTTFTYSDPPATAAPATIITILNM